jgi:hypothetical protein
MNLSTITGQINISHHSSIHWYSSLGCIAFELIQSSKIRHQTNKSHHSSIAIFQSLGSKAFEFLNSTNIIPHINISHSSRPFTYFAHLDANFPSWLIHRRSHYKLLFLLIIQFIYFDHFHAKNSSSLIHRTSYCTQIFLILLVRSLIPFTWMQSFSNDEFIEDHDSNKCFSLSFQSPISIACIESFLVPQFIDDHIWSPYFQS